MILNFLSEYLSIVIFLFISLLLSIGFIFINADNLLIKYNKLRYDDGSSWTAFGLTEAQTQTEANNASVAMSIALG